MCKYEQNFAIEKHKRKDGSIELYIRTILVRDKDSYPLGGGLDTCKEMPNFVATDDQLYFIPIRYTGKIVVQIVVMRLDLSAMAWKVVYNIGDHVLFIGSGKTTAFCSASKMGLGKGCLYFTLPGEQSLYKFDIEGNSVIVPCLNLRKPWQVPDFIMMPNGRKRKREEDTAHIRKDDKHEGKGDVGDFEKACSWGILNGDMVECIANCLHRLDYIHLRSVCKAYRALLPIVKNTSSSTTGTYLSPWMIFNRDHNRSIFSFINPMHNNENYLLKLSDLAGTVIHFQKGGWLLVSTENMKNCLFFYNPFTRETIELPFLPVNFTFSSISFTSLPTSSDCVVFGIELKGDNFDEVRLYFIRKGKATWTSCQFGNTNTNKYKPSFNTPVFYNGVFYCVDYSGIIGVFNMDDRSWKVLEKPYHEFSDVYPSFLVECGGEILLVKLGYLGKLFGIFRLDFTRMYWVIKNLGNHMLFVSCTSCVSAIAPNSRMENKVYFPRLCMNGEGVLFYCLATGSYQSLGSQHSASDFTDTEGWYSNCTWIEPNWSKSSAQELDWVKPPS